MLVLLALLLCSISSGQELQCHIQNGCEGLFLALTDEKNYNDCLNICKANNECNWFTFYEGIDNCLQYSDCPSIDESCTDCFSGQKECKQEGVPFGKLLAVGGFPGLNGRAELVDLRAENTTCPTIPRYQEATYGSVGTYIDGKALVCGGYPYNNKCYFYENSSDSWVQTVSMGQIRYMSSAVQLSSTEWWVTGGQLATQTTLNSTEIYTTNDQQEVSFTPYADLPVPLSEHNLVKLNSSHILLLSVGNFNPSNKTWIFNRDTGTWSPCMDMLLPRKQTQAGFVRFPNGREVVIVAGGQSINGEPTKTTEILDLSSMSWSFGPDLPVNAFLYAGASVQGEETFFIVGGYGDDKHLGTIIAFDPANEDWVMLEQELRQERIYFAAFLVPDEFADCV